MTCNIGSQCFFTQGYMNLKEIDFCEKQFNITSNMVQDNIKNTNERYGSDKPRGRCIFYINGEIGRPLFIYLFLFFKIFVHRSLQ